MIKKRMRRCTPSMRTSAALLRALNLFLAQFTLY
jgi:hypothetical protein